ncbi:metabolite traffic protein EboE [Thermithiobacillus tepidarius DSM 3134]|uniref:metabolite traffic protein EboE n=1 Tax=Thermithiobacillus tepidarius TaxID=929 RepID=UPI00041F11B5|nr:metabolite traffic protein EboE [Thermithiobacillus tepidarius]
MQIGAAHLTYCSNIHPGSGWDTVFANLRAHVPRLKARLAPQAPFGLGLRLSSRESEELLAAGRLAQFQDFLQEHGLYVFTLNGFPYGAFHGQAVKAAVFAPDWRDPARRDYTLRLAAILAALLPDGVEGGISTVPLSYKPWLAGAGEEAWLAMVRHLVEITTALARERERSGRLIHLDLEPEPDGLLEHSREVLRFYQDWLLPHGGRLLAERLGVTRDAARDLLLQHIQVCLDACHLAVEYEDPLAALARFALAGIRVGKAQLSAALRVPLPADRQRRARIARQLAPFAESTYLHQVIEERADGTLRHYPDLGAALPAIHAPAARQWRIHFHVPVFLARYGLFHSTREALQRLLACQQRTAFTRHLEIETYTWDVLPPALKLDLSDSIEREYRWVLGVLQAPHGLAVPAAS